MEKPYIQRIRRVLEPAMLSYLPQARWFMSKSRHINKVEILDHIVLEASGIGHCGSLLVILVHFQEGTADVYAVPVDFAEGERMQKIRREASGMVLLELRSRKNRKPHGILYDALIDAPFSLSLVGCLAEEIRVAGRIGTLVPELYRNDLKNVNLVAPKLGHFEQSNSAVLFPGQYFLKIYRRLEEGVHPEPELGLYLERTRKFTATPKVAGAWFYERKGQRYAMGILQEYVQSETDAWKLFAVLLSRFVNDTRGDPECLFRDGASALDLVGTHAFEPLNSRFTYLPMMARLLGQRTAEMHLALGSSHAAPEFAPEPFTSFYQRSLFQSFRDLAQNTVSRLESHLPLLNADTQNQVGELLQKFPDLLKCFDFVQTSNDNGQRIRIHGDFHLGQVLHTGKDFLFVDFEGEPARALAERRIKCSPLRDVAGMVRSFGYVAEYHIRRHPDISADETAANQARCAAQWLATEYLEQYFNIMGHSPLLSVNTKNRIGLLRAYTIEKALYEIGYEIENRPDWLAIPLRGILELSFPAAKPSF